MVHFYSNFRVICIYLFRQQEKSWHPCWQSPWSWSCCNQASSWYSPWRRSCFCYPPCWHSPCNYFCYISHSAVTRHGVGLVVINHRAFINTGLIYRDDASVNRYERTLAVPHSARDDSGGHVAGRPSIPAGDAEVSAPRPAEQRCSIWWSVLLNDCLFVFFGSLILKSGLIVSALRVYGLRSVHFSHSSGLLQQRWSSIEGPTTWATTWKRWTLKTSTRRPVIPTHSLSNSSSRLPTCDVRSSSPPCCKSYSSSPESTR